MDGYVSGDVEQIDSLSEHVAWLITDAAEKTLPLRKVRKHKMFRDRTLSQLCAKSKEARRVWHESAAGHYMRPSTLLETRCGNASGLICCAII